MKGARVSGEDGTRRERLWAAACHLGGLTVFAGIPLGNLLVPGAIWLSWKGASAFVEDQAREALNFQLTVLLAGLGCGVLMLAALGIPLLVALAIADAVMVIRAGLDAKDGKRHRYPYVIRFIPGPQGGVRRSS